MMKAVETFIEFFIRTLQTVEGKFHEDGVLIHGAQGMRSMTAVPRAREAAL